MSEPVARQRPMINLDEFERRLRQPAATPSQRKEDPLAELARLVGSEHDPYRGVFEETQQADPQQRSFGDDYESSFRPAAPNMRHMPRQGVGPDPRQSGQQRRAPENWGVPGGTAAAPRQPSAPAPGGSMRAEGPANGLMRGSAQRAPDTQNLGGNFAAIEAGLRGSIQPDYRTAPAQSYALDHHAQDHELPEDDDWFEEVQAAAPRPAAMVPSPAEYEPARPRRLLYVTAAIILVGMGGISLTFALKRGTASPQQIAMIKAATSPAKVQAPATSDGANAAMQDASVLDKTPQPPPVGVVNRQEQPVALPQTAAAAPSGSHADAASVPVPTPPTEAPPWEVGPGNAQSAPQGPTQAPAAANGPTTHARAQVADAAPSQAFGLGGLIQSRKVKTVTVRPDGSVVADDAPLQMPPEAQGAGPAAPNQGAAATAAPPVTSKATARVATPKSADVAEEPAAPSGSGVAASSTASAKTRAGHAKPVKVADLGVGNEAEAAAGHSGGDFAVQLAAPATEAEAHHAITRLMHSYQAELAGYPLKFHRAKVGDKSVYRVRVGGLSKAAAVKLCQSLQAKGGSCFVAKD